MPGSDLRRRSRNGRTSFASRCGDLLVLVRLDRRGPPAPERARAARAAPASSSRGSPTARTGCSPPVCRSARPAPAPARSAAPSPYRTTGSSRAGPRRRRAAPTDGRPAVRRPAARCRTSSGRNPSSAPSSDRAEPWKRRTGVPGANRWTSRSQLPSSDAGTDDERRACGIGRLLAVQVQRDERDRLAEAHVVGEAAAEAERGHPGQPAQAAQLVVAQGRLQARRVRRSARRRGPDRRSGRAARPASGSG